MVAQEKGAGRPAGTQEPVQSGHEQSFRSAGTEFTLLGFKADPDGKASVDSVSFRTRYQQRLAQAATPQPTDALPGAGLLLAPSIFTVPRAGRVEQVLGDMGISQISGAAVFGSDPSAKLNVDGEGFKSSWRIGHGGAQISHASPAISEFWDFFSGGKVSVSEATLHFDGKKVRLAPTIASEPLPGIRLSATSRINEVFDIIEGRPPLHTHSLSGSPRDPEAGMSLDAGRFLLNQYAFTGSPGSSLFALDFIPHDGMSNHSLILGTIPSLGNFLGARSTFAADNIGGVFSPVGEYGTSYPFSTSNTRYLFAQGDMLYYQAPDGTHGVAGALSVERAARSHSLQLKLQVDRNFGLFGEPQGVLLGGSRPDWAASLFLELRFGGNLQGLDWRR